MLNGRVGCFSTKPFLGPRWKWPLGLFDWFWPPFLMRNTQGDWVGPPSAVSPSSPPIEVDLGLVWLNLARANDMGASGGGRTFVSK